ncbi:hypothetical protein LTR86_003985 [Recurvomyces mirabilis]|nr:hypothetical protein LTR86_003985 [Recurvomyces mirabilis]
MLSAVVSLLCCLVSVASGVTYTVNCAAYPDACNHRCYSIYAAGAAGTVTWDNAGDQVIRQRRTAAGATNGVCCAGGAINAPTGCLDENGNPAPHGCDSPDEYPYASTQQGGAGAIIRCMSREQNRLEGSDFSSYLSLATQHGGCGLNAPCQVTLTFGHLNTDTPYCLARAQQGPLGPNDGFEWRIAGGAWILARDGRNATLYAHNGTLERHTPDPSLYVPQHKRRELLLDNGERILVGDIHTTVDWKQEIFWMDGKRHRAIRELSGEEKSPGLRPSDQYSQM